MSGRFDYVKYDQMAQRRQEGFKIMCESFEMSLKTMPDGRYKSLALTALEEVYCWIGKAIRDEQIQRNGSAEPQEDRSNS